MLTGHRKSGTTLLHKLFDSHHELNVYPIDLTVLYAYYPCWTTTKYNDFECKERLTQVITKTLSPIIESKNNRSEKPDINKFLKILFEIKELKELKSPAGLIKGIGEAYCRWLELDSSKPFLFKETSQTVNLAGMISEGLDVACVQIIRDPRDNYAAIKDGVKNYYSKYGENDFASLASVLNRAKMDLELATECRTFFKDRFTAIRFEDLIEQPKQTMLNISSFLKLNWSATLLEPTVLGEKFNSNTYGNEKIYGISKKNVGRWRDRISYDECAVIEAWMKTAMLDWGYQLVTSHFERLSALERFYAKYNCKYFYKDVFVEELK